MRNEGYTLPSEVGLPFRTFHYIWDVILSFDRLMPRIPDYRHMVRLAGLWQNNYSEIATLIVHNYGHTHSTILLKIRNVYIILT